MKLLFFGTSDFSKPVFEALKKGGYSPLLWDLNNPLERFKEIKPDVCVVAAYGKIIPKEYLEIPKHGFLNVHPSLLPKYRGATPIQTAVLNGDTETGITIILMDEKIDHGPIAAKKEVRIAKHDNYKSLEQKLAKFGGEVLNEILPKWITGEIKPVEQNHNEATYTKKFSWPDGKIDWSKSAEEINRKIRALDPEPGVWTEWNNKVLKIIEAEPIESDLGGEVGQVAAIENEIIVKCGSGGLILKEVQLEGRNKMTAANFVRGRQEFIGSVLKETS